MQSNRHPTLYILSIGLWHGRTEKEKIVQNLLFAELITGDLEPVFHVAGGSGSERAIKKIFGDLSAFASHQLFVQ